MSMKTLTTCASAAALLFFADFATAQMTFSLDKASYGSGENVVATWMNGPGNANDWIFFYGPLWLFSVFVSGLVPHTQSKTPKNTTF